MTEIRNEIHDLADTMKAKFTPPDYVPGCLVKSVADKDAYTTNNGWVEAIVGQHGQQRVRYYGDPAGLVVDTSYIDVEYFPNYRLYRVFGASEGGTATSGGAKVDKVWESDYGAVALSSDAAGVISIVSDLAHTGDADTKISFTDDDIEVTVGGLSMLKLAEDAQDVITLGPGSGDVDIDFNGDMFLRGSDGFFGVNITAPSNSDHLFEVASGGNLGIANASFSTDTTFAGQPFIRMLKSHTNTIGSLVATIDGERLAVMNVSGVDSANALRATAGFRVTQRGAAGVGDVPSEMGLVAANNKVVMLLDENMDVLIANNTSPTVGAQLHVDQTSATGAQPVLLLVQNDVSEEMIQFNTTIGTGNAIEAVGAKTLTTTHFIKVTLPGSLTRYIPVGTIA